MSLPVHQAAYFLLMYPGLQESFLGLLMLVPDNYVTDRQHDQSKKQTEDRGDN